jgi:hypothetical protein
MTIEDMLRDELHRAAATIPDADTPLEQVVRHGRRRRNRNRGAVAAVAVAVVAIVVGLGATVLELPGSSTFTGESELEVGDVPPTTIETITLDGRTLTIDAPGDVVASEPVTMVVRFVGDTGGLTVTTTDAGPGDTPGGEEPELVEERWDGEIRIAATPEGVPVAIYDDGETRLVLTADAGPSLEPVTSTEELLAAFEGIDIERTDAGPVVTAADPDLERGLSLTYELTGIDAELRVFDDPELAMMMPLEPVEEPITGAGGEVIIGETAVESGFIELTGVDASARIQLILADEDEQQRALDLMTQLELELN